MLEINNTKNRERDDYTFANINLLGKCNVDCFFCLGKDIEKELSCHNQVKEDFLHWRNFEDFLKKARVEGVRKLYVTGQNTDALVYPYLPDLIDYLHRNDFQVGLRTNGYMFKENPGLVEVCNCCELSTGLSIHSLSPVTTRMILNRKEVVDWDNIIPKLARPRVSIVLNRCNEYEFFDLLKYLSKFKNIRYVQVRRVSTDTRLDLLAPDIAAYERIYTQTRAIFGPPARKFVADAEEYDIYGQKVVFWRTVKTSVNSLNYFTDGTISDLYFVVEGYLKYRSKDEQSSA